MKFHSSGHTLFGGLSIALLTPNRLLMYQKLKKINQSVHSLIKKYRCIYFIDKHIFYPIYVTSVCMPSSVIPIKLNNLVLKAVGTELASKSIITLRKLVKQ